jgi:hypothetical protein
MNAALLLTPLLFLVMPLVMARLESRLGDIHAIEPRPQAAPQLRERRRPAAHRRA